MKLETYLAVGELVQASAHQHGIVGPVEFDVLSPRDHENTDTDTNNRPDQSDAAGLPFGDFFYA